MKKGQILNYKHDDKELVVVFVGYSKFKNDLNLFKGVVIKSSDIKLGVGVYSKQFDLCNFSLKTN